MAVWWRSFTKIWHSSLEETVPKWASDPPVPSPIDHSEGKVSRNKYYRISYKYNKNRNWSQNETTHLYISYLPVNFMQIPYPIWTATSCLHVNPCLHFPDLQSPVKSHPQASPSSNPKWIMNNR